MTDDALTITLCQWLAAAGIGVWSPAAPAPSDAAAIFYGPLGEHPDRAVGVTVYGTDDDVALGTGTRRVQVRYRGASDDVRGANLLADAGFEALHGVHYRDGIARARRISSAPLGPDADGRQERTDNFEIILSPHPEAAP